MSPHYRKLIAGAVVGLLLASTHPALAQSSAAEEANALNEEGKKLYKDEDYTAAAEKFRQAIAKSPEARFYFNLCVAHEKQGDFDKALEACDHVYGHDPSSELKAKTGERARDIRAKKKRRDEQAGDSAGTTASASGQSGQASSGAPGSGPGPGAGNGSSPSGYTNPSSGGWGTPPSSQGTATGRGGQGTGSPGTYMPGTYTPQITRRIEPGLDYLNGFGFELGSLGNKGIGGDNFKDRGVSVRLYYDRLVFPERKLGARTSIDIDALATGQDEIEGVTQQNLSIVDLGIGLFYHQKLMNSVYLTPHVGMLLSVQQPESLENEEGFLTAGGRFELAWQFLLAPRHVLTLTLPSIKGYLPVAGKANGIPAKYYDLDRGSASVTVSLGYTYRWRGAGFGTLILE
ncbi:MAG: tetratricopeptide repeat protein [Deltaproteobacteria bacterium]|nr:tetratricopeptide repeat protein [Deltaproteobacteria bacterium]